MKEGRMTDQTPSPEAILSLASQLADGAAEHTLKWFRAPALVTQNKWSEGFDPVTEADKAAELAMRALLKAQRPEDCCDWRRVAGYFWHIWSVLGA
jgi:myo-inositol-1(or 4)-monophosphatase